jgi:lipopolysaccharide export system protein LptC
MRTQGWQTGYAALVGAAPVVIMGLLALFTFWLERQTQASQPKAAAAQASTEPDYTVRNFVAKQFDANGVLSSELQGEVGTHFPDREVLRVTQATLRSLNDTSPPVTARADRLWAWDDGQRFELQGQAVVTQQRQGQEVRMTSQRLVYAQPESRVWTDQAVRVQRGSRQVITARRFEYRTDTGVVQFEGRVRAVWQADAPNKTPPQGAAS